MVRLCLAGGCLSVNIEALFGEASRYFAEGDFASAIRFYHRILELSPHHPDALQPLGVLAQRAGKTHLALQLFEEALAARPDFPQVLYNRSVLLRLLGRHDEALEAAQRAVVNDPQLAEAWDIVGQLFKDKGDYVQANKCHLRALGLQPRNAHFNGNYALLMLAMDDLDTAFRAASEAQRLDPFYPPTLLGNILQAMGYPDLAAEHFARARELRPDFPAAAASEAMARLQMGDLDQGFALFEQRPDMESNYKTIPFWEGEPVDKLVVYEDQGLGDALQFLRYLPLLQNRAQRIFLRVKPPLRDLCAKNFPDITLIDDEFPAVRARCRLSSLPFFFKARLTTIPHPPYLSADTTLRAAWRERLKNVPRTRVGLVWAGNSLYRLDSQRSLKFDDILPVIATAKEHGISLQCGRAQDSEALAKTKMFDAAPLLSNFAETAALISELDLIITADTAVAHLAGALNKPVWIMLPFSSDWRWLLGRNDSPWYPSARLFRQKTSKKWRDVVGDVNADLEKFLQGDRSVLAPKVYKDECLRRSPDALSLPA